jgi:hypothetical protein
MGSLSVDSFPPAARAFPDATYGDEIYLFRSK